MWNLIAKTVLAILAHADDVTGLVGAVESEVATIAHGEGGPEKVARAAANAGALAASLGKVATDIGGAGA